MERERLIYISTDDFVNDMIAFDKKYGHENFFSEDTYEDGKLILECGYTRGDDTAVSIYATEKRIVYIELSEMDAFRAVVRTDMNAEKFETCYQMLYSGFDLEEADENDDEE